MQKFLNPQTVQRSSKRSIWPIFSKASTDARTECLDGGPHQKQEADAFELWDVHSLVSSVFGCLKCSAKAMLEGPPSFESKDCSKVGDRIGKNGGRLFFFVKEFEFRSRNDWGKKNQNRPQDKDTSLNHPNHQKNNTAISCRFSLLWPHLGHLAVVIKKEGWPSAWVYLCCKVHICSSVQTNGREWSFVIQVRIQVSGQRACLSFTAQNRARSNKVALSAPRSCSGEGLGSANCLRPAMTITMAMRWAPLLAESSTAKKTSLIFHFALFMPLMTKAPPPMRLGPPQVHCVLVPGLCALSRTFVSFCLRRIDDTTGLHSTDVLLGL